MEELLANPLKAKLAAEPDKTELVNFLNDDEKKSIGKNEGALLTLLVEARRRKWSNASLVEYLDTHLELDIDATKKVLEAYEGSKARIDVCLHSTAIRRSRLVGFRVEPYFEVYNSKAGRVNLPKCLVELDLMKVDNGQDKYQFICKQNELQALIADLKDMINIARKFKERSL